MSWHSGRHAFRSRLTELGYDNLGEDDLNRAFIRFKEVADKKEISNADLESIVGDEIKVDITDRYKLVGIGYSAATATPPPPPPPSSTRSHKKRRPSPPPAQGPWMLPSRPFAARWMTSKASSCWSIPSPA